MRRARLVGAERDRSDCGRAEYVGFPYVRVISSVLVFLFSIACLSVVPSSVTHVILCCSSLVLVVLLLLSW